MEIHPDLAQDAIFHIHRVRRQRGHQVKIVILTLKF